MAEEVKYNPHPNAICPRCEGTKWNVNWEACSQECAEILGFSKEGLPDKDKKMEEYLREIGISPKTGWEW